MKAEYHEAMSKANCICEKVASDQSWQKFNTDDFVGKLKGAMANLQKETAAMSETNVLFPQGCFNSMGVRLGSPLFLTLFIRRRPVPRI